MNRKFLSATVVAAALGGIAVPVQADISIMYPEWIASLVEPGIASFEAATGQTVTSIMLPGEGYDRRIAVDLAAGTAADVAVVDSFMVAELASAGYLAPLNDPLAGWDQFQYYMPGLLDVVSYSGSVFALPTDTDVRMLWYDRSLFEAAGIAMPWTPQTWDDVLATAQILKDSGVENAFILPAGTKQGEGATMQGFYMALLGADTPEDDRNRLRNWAEEKWIGDSPALRATVSLYHEVYNVRQLTSASINYATDIGAAVREALANDEVGIIASGSWEWVCLFDCSGVNVPSVEERNAMLGWTPWPGSGAEGAPATTNISGGWAIGVNAAASDPDMAVSLLTTIFDYENFAAWTLTNGRMAVRTDISESAPYLENAFLAEATKLAATTTGRDTYPGYQVVSALVQEMTAAILDGVSPEDALAEYRAALVDEFSEENVIVYE
ncbi:MAG: extracellular solute-binding protein [Rhodobacteraceae bacterium]|nr:extracellular solute-binding protein [Paracoccaceae bacterium]